MNLFLVESPFQLINAIEAKHRLDFRDNKLVVILGYGYSRTGFQQLISGDDWNSVEYINIENANSDFQSALLGKYLSRRIRDVAAILRLYSNKTVIDRMANSIHGVDNIVLGNYPEDGSQYLRHFANSVKHNRLVLIDDGTDVIKVNAWRKRPPPHDDVSIKDVVGLSRWKSAKRKVREYFLRLDDSAAEKVLFFTAYNIDVRTGDEIVKNEYAHLRRNIVGGVQTDDVFFLGQCLIEDNWIDKQLYFDNLSKIQKYFGRREVVYVPHPRESSDTIDFVKDALGFKIRQFDGPIEYWLCVGGDWPRILASFFCSALINCSIIYQGVLSIKAFYIDPELMLVERDFVREVYDYFYTRSGDGLEVVKLDSLNSSAPTVS